MHDPLLIVRSQEPERQQRVDQRKDNEFGDPLDIRANRSRTQQAQEQEDAAADEESEEDDDKGGAAVLLGRDYLLNRSE